MPEGPEILFLSTYLKHKFLNQTIGNIKSHCNFQIVVPQDLQGKIVDVNCKGKILYLKLSSNTEDKFYYLHIHFGLEGWIVFKDCKFIKYEFTITDSTNKPIKLMIPDKLKLSKMEFYCETIHTNIINNLGIDILTEDFSLEIFKKKCKSRRMKLLALLLKQDIFCGIGNYIKNEAIYLSGLKPHIQSNQLTDEEYELLYKNILFVSYSSAKEQLLSKKLYENLDNKYKINEPTILEIPYNYKIYKQTITPNGKAVKKITVAGRDTYILA